MTTWMRFTVVRRMAGRKRTVHIYKTIVLGHARYTLRAGRSALVSVRLRKASGTMGAWATATTPGGTNVARKIKLVPVVHA